MSKYFNTKPPFIDFSPLALLQFHQGGFVLTLLRMNPFLRPIISYMGKKLNPKNTKKYFTLMETLWKIGAPLLVAVGKTIIENKFPLFK